MKGAAVDFEYNEHGKLSKKRLFNSIVSTYKYNDAGFLTHLIHEASGHVLDEYQYSYDALGRKTRTEKRCSGLANENGLYVYQYDTAGHIISVEKDGVLLRQYAYDSFDNRTFLKDADGEVSYIYNEANQLIREVSKTIPFRSEIDGVHQPVGRELQRESESIKEYSYDKRGNLKSIIEDGKNICSYRFNAENRIELAENMNEECSVYGYNGLGMRIYKETGHMVGMELNTTSRADYTLNLYHYDEFGNETNDKGSEEPGFQYTGYAKDNISGTYFAQAREYIPAIGRFISEDIEKGKILHPITLNHYSYCWGNPVTLVDLNGRSPVFSQKDANETIWNYYTNKLKDEWNSAVNALGKSWDLTVNSYKCGWNNLMDFNIAYIAARIFVTEKLTGAKTVNISIAGRVEAGASVNTAVGITYDLRMLTVALINHAVYYLHTIVARIHIRIWKICFDRIYRQGEHYG